MKVLLHKEDPSKLWKVNLWCSSGDSLLEIEREDVRFRMMPATDKGHTFELEEFFVVCPECKRETVFGLSLPTSVRQYVRWRNGKGERPRAGQ